MGEKLGEGRRAGDGRRSGHQSRVAHTVQGDSDMVGDRRKLRGAGDTHVGSTEGASRIVPVAAIAGAEKAETPQNGGGRRAVPKAMKAGEW